MNIVLERNGFDLMTLNEDITIESYKDLIIEKLEENNYLVRSNKCFDKTNAMDTELLFEFLNNTQKKEMEKLNKKYKPNPKNSIKKYINDSIYKETLLYSLKHGINMESRFKLNLMYRKPETSINKEQFNKYDNNILSIMKNVNYEKDDTADLVIFLNGLAIFSIDLGLNTSEEDYHNIINKYKQKDYNSRLYNFKSGCLANFAMDLNEVYVCTNLRGNETSFLPFNKGKGQGINIGKGNPENPNGPNVSYMWENILTKDMVINLIENFIFLQKSKDENKDNYKEIMFFPRYHQLNVVQKLVEDMKKNHTKKNYLIEHSAGSGKTKTITWLADNLSSLNDEENEAIFDTILIVTDRKIVDKQLQDSILNIEHKNGLINVMSKGKTSEDLAKALISNDKIIVTTIQKFLYIIENKLLRKITDKTFAVIIDEAHSSTSGFSLNALNKTLSPNKRLPNEESDLYDVIKNDINLFKKQPNVSIIGFTATPKAETLQTFGTSKGNKKIPFDVYPMKQAIEEGFILDVLENYTTYETFSDLNKDIYDDPKLNSKSTQQKIAKMIELDTNNIDQKLEIIIEHYKSNIENQLNGNAKAMIITSSIKAAITYKSLFEKYVKSHNYNLKALVAFSGTAEYNENSYTEVGMNNISESSLSDEFDTNKYQFLIVANKYQTGFDQPKLVVMYVDKRLNGVAAVQTLSRLNRTYLPYDKKTFILDFKNSYKEIENAFSPYYGATSLGNPIIPRKIYSKLSKLYEYNFIDNDDKIDEFNNLYYENDKKGSNEILKNSLSKIYEFEPEKQIEIKNQIKSFTKFYTTLLQSTEFYDPKLHEKYNFLKIVEKNIENKKVILDNFNVENNIKTFNITQKQKEVVINHEMQINPEINLPSTNGFKLNSQQVKKLSEIIENHNKSHGSDLNIPKSIKIIDNACKNSTKDEKLKNSAKNNKPEDFKLTFKDSITEKIKDGYKQNIEEREIYRSLLTYEDFIDSIINSIYNNVYNILKSEN